MGAIIHTLAAAALALLAGSSASAESGIVRDYEDLGGASYNITWDMRSLRMNDKPVLLQSGSFHYPRSTPAMWPRLMAEARANGLNAISSYVFWNVHARSENGTYDYSGAGNVTAFLQAISHTTRIV